MAHSLSSLMSSGAALLRSERNETAKFVVHLEVVSNSMVELDADDAQHANNIARDWLINGRCISAGIRQRSKAGYLSSTVDVLDVSDFEDELAEATQSNLNRVMSQYGLAF